MHVYRQPGAYDVRLTVTDDSGTVRNTACDLLHVLVNQAPIADAGPDQVGAPGQELTFVGSGSLDPGRRHRRVCFGTSRTAPPPPASG